MVGSEQFKSEANILFDEGAQRSFIRQDLVRQLQIKPTRKENVCLSAFGATTLAVRQLNVVTLTLMTDTNEQLTLEALVVPEIATPFQNNLPSIVPNLHYLKGLKLAHPVTANEQFDISLLIGVEVMDRWQQSQNLDTYFRDLSIPMYQLQPPFMLLMS